jgi:hypothetical protein
MIVILGDGLEDIGWGAFYGCTFYVSIPTPPAIRAIQGYAFYNCSGLMTVILNNRMEKIEPQAF